MFCRDWTIVKRGLDRAEVAPLKCRRWSCPECAPDRQKALRAEAYAGHPTTFITLTSNPAMLESPVARAAALVHAWRLLRLRIMRKHNLKRFPFLAVFEATKRAEPHLHILARAPFVPQAWLSNQMRELTNSPIVDIRKVKNAGMAAAYVAKYIGKNPQRFGTLKRYWKSRDWTATSEDDLDHEAAHGFTVEVWRVSKAEALWKLYGEGWLQHGRQDDCTILKRGPPSQLAAIIYSGFAR